MSSPEPDQNLNPFSAPAVAATGNPDQPQTSLGQYSTVRMGLRLMYYSIAAIALLVIFMVVITFASFGLMSGGGNGPGLSLFGAIGLLSLGMIGAFLASLVGICMCGTCPNPNEKTLALTSIVCFFLYVGSSISGRFVLSLFDVQFAAILLTVTRGGGSLASIVGSITFCLLLKRIGKNISSQRMMKTAHNALVWFVILIVSVFVGATLMWVVEISRANSMRPDPGFAFLFLGIFAIVGLVSFFLYLAMLRAGINELDPNRDVEI